jgi:SAM-dependent methyltransferase
MTTYREYVEDEDFHRGYAEYQRRYATQPPERDKVTIELVRRLVAGRTGVRLLDAGCSTGNLLLHLSRAVPGLELTGGELVDAVIEANRRNPDLAGTTFERLDVLDLPAARWDIVVVNAVFYLFPWGEFERALASVSRALVPGGSLVAFDFFHEWGQDLAIVERSETHPNGLALHLRPQRDVEPLLRRHGFERVEFRPFSIPIDLPRPERLEDMGSYTRRTEDGERLLFRGALFQPWCHLVATKA